MISAILCARFDRGKIGSVIRFGESLAPNLLGRRNLRDVAPLLLRRSPLHQRWSDAGDALEVDGRRRLRAVQLLVVDELLDQRCAAPAKFFGPVDAYPARVVEGAMPRAAFFKFGLGIGIGQFTVIAPVARNILFQPASELAPKLFVFFA